MKDEVTIKVTIWNEGRHEKLHPNVAAIYPSGIHGAIAAGLKNEGFAIRCGSLDDPDEGLGEQLLDDTDVLLWWGHIAHDEVSDALVNRIRHHVLKGMGLIVLHSGHHSKLFRRLMGTNCNLAWRELPEGDLERIWVVNPSHPIAAGLPPFFEVPQSEMHGEPFHIPQPPELLFLSCFPPPAIFRSRST